MRNRVWSHVRGNAVAYIALFFALTGGTAYALAGSNTVFSDDITDGQVRSQDVADDFGSGALTGRDIRSNTLTGADISETSLAVPRGFTKANTFASGGSLTLNVPTVGVLTIDCANGGTAGDDSDDEVSFVFTNESGFTATAGFGLHARGGTTLEDTVSLADSTGYSFQSAKAIYANVVITPPSNHPGASFDASAEQVDGSNNCLGTIQAIRTG